jgi:hypothetical protein
MAEPTASGAPGREPADEHGPRAGDSVWGARAPQPGGVVLGPARYVPLTAEQEREAITALARLLALVREQHQQQSS